MVRVPSWWGGFTLLLGLVSGRRGRSDGLGPRRPYVSAEEAVAIYTTTVLYRRRSFVAVEWIRTASRPRLASKLLEIEKETTHGLV